MTLKVSYTKKKKPKQQQTNKNQKKKKNTTTTTKTHIINIYMHKKHIYYIGSAVGNISLMCGNWNSSFQTMLIHSNTPIPVSPKIKHNFLRLKLSSDHWNYGTVSQFKLWKNFAFYWNNCKHKRIIWSVMQQHLNHAAISQRHCVWVLTVKQSVAEFSICSPW